MSECLHLVAQLNTTGARRQYSTPLTLSVMVDDLEKGRGDEKQAREKQKTYSLILNISYDHVLRFDMGSTG